MQLYNCSFHLRLGLQLFQVTDRLTSPQSFPVQQKQHSEKAPSKFQVIHFMPKIVLEPSLVKLTSYKHNFMPDKCIVEPQKDMLKT